MNLLIIALLVGLNAFGYHFQFTKSSMHQVSQSNRHS